MEELDKIFSKYIRSRDTDFAGNGYCISCGIKTNSYQAQCGHMRDRWKKSTRWYDGNCFMQCAPCNEGKSGNIVKYEAEVIKRYGQEHLDNVNWLSHQTLKVDRFWYQEQMQYFTDMLELVEKIKRKSDKLPEELWQFDVIKYAESLLIFKQ